MHPWTPCFTWYIICRVPGITLRHPQLQANRQTVTMVPQQDDPGHVLRPHWLLAAVCDQSGDTLHRAGAGSPGG